MIAVAAVLWALTALIVLVGAWGLLIEPARLEVARYVLPIPHLPAELDGLTVGHLSDLHLRGSGRTRRIVERALGQLRDQHPDLICLSGDVVDHAEFMAEGVEALKLLSAPLGVFMVLGNHDCDATMEDFLYGNPDCDVAQQGWRGALAGTELELLVNEWRAVETRGKRVVIAGIGDLYAGQDDLPRALAGAPEGDLRVLLCHSPDALDLPGAQWADLLLAGHTHGGQLQAPGVGSVWAPVWRLRHRAHGLLRLGHTLLFVNRGVSSSFPARINCRPQIALLELKAGSAEAVTETYRVAHPALREAYEA